MPLFICRWQNGDFSAVSASSREEDMELLDEGRNADVAEVFTVNRFMLHFQLKKQVDSVEDPVPVDLEGFGEETYDTFCERVYPEMSPRQSRIAELSFFGGLSIEETSEFLGVSSATLEREWP
jgi:hypothetical protein